MGFEPIQSGNLNMPTAGHEVSNSGHKDTKVGHLDGCSTVSDVNKRTGDLDPKGQSWTLMDPNGAPTGNSLPQDLILVMDAWSDLPETVKAGILAMVKVAMK